jgi:hypothetical protein
MNYEQGIFHLLIEVIYDVNYIDNYITRMTGRLNLVLLSELDE